jgi:hypothetical protein
MRIPFLHPALDQLSEFSVHPDRERIARHLCHCRTCQETLRLIRRVEHVAPNVLRAELPTGLLERILASRESGIRFIGPSVSDRVSRDSSRLPIAVIAAGLVAVAALTLLSTRGDVIAGESESQLVVSPIAPRSGERIEIEYRPVVLSFKDANRLVLRGRLRSAEDQMYSSGRRLRILADLRRGEDGVFRGAFLLPDSVVFVAMVVEDSLATTVDTRDGELWTVVVHGPDGKPTHEALSQRQNDFMGRSWEEAYATAKLNVQLHPQYLLAWNELEFFEKALLGDKAADSLARSRQAMVDSLINRYRSAARVPSSELSTIVWRSFVKHDTSALDFWYDRLRREAPHDPQVAQLATVRLYQRYWKIAPRTLLDSLESLWANVAPVHGPGTLIITTGEQVARQVGDGKAYLRWVNRAPGEDSLFRSGAALANFAPTRAEGMRRIRAALKQSTADFESDRPLTLNETEYRRVFADRRRELLATLGEALIAANKPREGLDTLSLAIRDGWNLQLLKRVASRRLLLGDTIGALATEAKIVVDPRTSASHVDSASRQAARRFSQAQWSEMRANARTVMVHEVMNRSLMRTIRGDPTMVNAAGGIQHLSILTAGNPSVIVYWSRHCGPALEALPAIDSVGRILRGRGIAAYLVLDESPSEETTRFFHEHMLGIPVLYDFNREVATALRNFGTPAYYVLDEYGRIRFNHVNDVNDILLQVAAIQAETKANKETPAQLQ